MLLKDFAIYGKGLIVVLGLFCRLFATSSDEQRYNNAGHVFLGCVSCCIIYVGFLVLLIFSWSLISCTGVSNEIQHDFVIQLQRKEERSRTQKKIQANQKQELQEKAKRKWDEIAPCVMEPNESCIRQVRQYVAQFEYAVVQSHSEENIDSIQSVRIVVPYVAEAKSWLAEHDSLWLREKQIHSRYNMKRIQSDVFVMGCQPGDTRCNEDEFPPHVVMLSRDFYLGTTEVTQDLYEYITGKNPSRFRNCGASCPVENISFFDVVEFLNMLSDQESLPRCYLGTEKDIRFVGMDCTGYRLPSEAEWEYAARTTESFLFAGGNEPDELAWHKGNSQERTHPVGQKQPNKFGLYDMSGNVLEWCTDWYWEYTEDNQTDPVRTEQTESKVGRGGSWFEDAMQSRTSERYYEDPKFRYDLLGFRIAQTILE